MSERRVLITGGAGFLGSHLAERFQHEGLRVRLLDLVPCPSWAQSAGIEYVRGDTRDRAVVAAALRHADIVIHTAFASPQHTRDTILKVNTEGTQTLCAEALAQGVPRCVVLSSTIVSKPSRVHPLWPDSPLTRLDVYRASRQEAEEIAMAFADRGLSVAIVRPKTFIGPGRVSAFAILFEWVRLGRPIPVLGPGRNHYQLVDIRDMVEGIWRLGVTQAGGVFGFGAQDFQTVREDLQALLTHARTGARLWFVPDRLARAVLRGIELANLVPLSEWHYMSARSEDAVIDISRAEQELGWQPQHSNAQALVEAYKWYVSQVRTTGTAQMSHPVPFSHGLVQRLGRFFPRGD